MQTLQSLNRKRICAYCKKNLNISTISDVQETVLCQNKYYHTNCFKEMCIKENLTNILDKLVEVFDEFEYE